MRACCDLSRVNERAATASSTCKAEVAPKIGAVMPGRPSVQASATCEGKRPVSRATAATAS